MSMRFRRSVRIAPGIRLNVSKRGLGLSAGVRGAGVSIGPGGKRVHAGIPGTGLSWNQKVGGHRGPASRRAAKQPQLPDGPYTLLLDRETGALDIEDGAGENLSESQARELKRHQGDKIEEWLVAQADAINSQIHMLDQLHWPICDPQTARDDRPASFSESRPAAPSLPAIRWLDKLLPWRKRRIVRERQSLQEDYEQALADWAARREEHEQKDQAKRDAMARARGGDISAMDDFFEFVLDDIDWPYETHVSYEVLDTGHLNIDVDLPEIEDLNLRTASVPNRGMKLSMRELSQTARRKLYRDHVHSIGLRLLGEAFHALPTLLSVTLSAYSQRLDPSTGHINDDYLYSVRVSRAQFAGLNFDDTSAIDPVRAFEGFGARRNMTKTGIFRAIEPLA